MTRHILLGREKQIIAMPQAAWEEHLVDAAHQMRKRLAFMSADHHRVRNFCASELVLHQLALQSGFIATELKISPEKVLKILDDLERNLFFVVRNVAGAVSWAFPVTIEPTPHVITFDTGERLYGA